MAFDQLSDIAAMGIRLAAPDLIYIFVLVIIAVAGIKIIERITSKLKRKIGDPLKLKLTSGIIEVIFVSVILVLMLSRVGVTEDLIKLIGLVVGGIVAFSSTSLILNIVAGFIIHITKPFSLGEVIDVGGVVGKVDDVRMVYTSIYTFQKTTVNVPNANFIKDNIINYSKTGFRVSAKVTLGYDIARVQAEDLLIRAAKFIHLEDVFVSITDLKNYSVEYEINGTSHEAEALPFISSRLRKVVLDEFAMASLEVMSPMIVAHRQTQKVLPKTGVKEKVRLRKREKEEAAGIRKQVNDTFEERKKKAKKKPKKSKK